MPCFFVKNLVVVNYFYSLFAKNQLPNSLKQSVMTSENHTSTHAIAYLNASFECFHVNAKLCQLLGYSSAEFLAMDIVTMTQLVHPEDGTPWPERSKLFDDSTFTGTKDRQRVIRKDGSIVTVDKTISVSRDIEGHPIVILVALEEV